MLDIYTFGKADRLSPEAPVPLLRVEKETFLPGGAGNAVLNLVSLGMEVVAMGRLGNDDAGQHLLEVIDEPLIHTEHLFIDDDFTTPVKKRMIADQQQLLRVDYEKVVPLPPSMEKRVKESLDHLVPQMATVALSDYGKGFLTPSLLQYVIQLARRYSVPVIVDPKGREFTRYRGATLIKPNLMEAYQAANAAPHEPLPQVATSLLHITEADVVMITRAKDGISLFWRDGRHHDYPAAVKEVRDVTGAGDTVLAVITAILANGCDLQEGAILSNIAAGIAIERLGCARVSLEEIAARV